MENRKVRGAAIHRTATVGEASRRGEGELQVTCDCVQTSVMTTSGTRHPRANAHGSYVGVCERCNGGPAESRGAVEMRKRNKNLEKTRRSRGTSRKRHRRGGTHLVGRGRLECPATRGQTAGHSWVTQRNARALAREAEGGNGDPGRDCDTIRQSPASWDQPLG